MAYTNTIGVNATLPAGTEPANEIHLDIQAVKTAFIERLDDVLGADFANDDPVSAESLKLNRAANTKVLIGTTSTDFREDDDSESILKLTESNVELTKPADFKNGSITSAGLHAPRRHTQTGGTIDWTNGNVQRCTITTTTTISFTNPVVGAVLILEVLMDGSGGHTTTFNGSIVWGGGTAPTVTNVANRKDVFGFLCVASNAFLGFVLDQNFANTN